MYGTPFFSLRPSYYKIDIIIIAMAMSPVCPKCKTIYNRDENASYNIKYEGASSYGVGDVSSPYKAAVSV